MNKFLVIAGSMGAITAVALYLLYLGGTYGKLDCVRKLSFYIDAYMRGGMHKTRFRILDPATGRHLWFVKLTPTMRKYGPTRFFLRLTPDGCSSEEFARAQQALRNAGIEYYLTSEHAPSPRTIVVHCDMDVDKAVRAARCIMTGVFGLCDSDLLRYGIYGPTDRRHDRIIGWDDNIDLARYVRERAAAGRPIPERFRKTGGSSVS